MDNAFEKCLWLKPFGKLHFNYIHRCMDLVLGNLFNVIVGILIEICGKCPREASRHNLPDLKNRTGIVNTKD